MFKKLLLSSILLLLSVSGLGSADAQQPPLPEGFHAALKDLSTRLGIQFMISCSDPSDGSTCAMNDPALNWSWNEDVYPDDSLGCPFATVTATGERRAFQFVFTYQEVVYDYRQDVDAGSFFLCMENNVVPVNTNEPNASEEAEEHTVGVQLITDGLAAPVALASPNDGSGRLFVVDQVGMIWVISASGQRLPTAFLDLSAQLVPLQPDYDERGLLGLAFHPDFANNGRFFVYYSMPLRAEAPPDWDHTNVLAEFDVSSGNPDIADPASQKVVMQIDQPQFNHNSGHIAFGPDGYLYIPIGDGGGANDIDVGHTETLGNAQDLTNLHGSILRIDVNSTPGTYTIPSDNPFWGQDSITGEIYAFGFRNPYHISFDRGTGVLFAADTGQDLYEEVDIVTAGGNYGWHVKEGTHCFDAINPSVPLQQCPTTGMGGEALIDPIIEYSHADVGVVVIGGYVYRGNRLPGLVGYYIFGDYTRTLEGPPDGTLLWAEAPEAGGMWSWGELKVAGMANERLGEYVRGFGEGQDGELYVLSSQNVAPSGTTGKVWKLVPAVELTQNSSTVSSEPTAEISTPATPAPLQTEEASN